jgi:YidC/Oxa1 family membrane protein insertase
MAQTENSGGPGQPRKEMSMEIRLLLAFLLMGAVMFLTPYLFKTQQPAPGAKKQGESAQVAKPPETPAAEPAEAVKPAVAPARAGAAKKAGGPPATPQQQLPNLAIDTNLFRVEFNNHGATVRSWVLKKSKGNDGKPLDLVNTAATLEFPFSFHMPGQEAVAKTLNWAYYAQEVDPDGLGVTYTFSNEAGIRAKKTFRFNKDSYLSELSTEVSVDGKPVSALIAWRGGFGDLTVSTAAANGRALYFNVPENKLTEQHAGAAKNGPVSTSGDFSFAGLADNYFAAVFLPQGQVSVREVTFADRTRTPFDANPQIHTGVAVGDGAENRFQLFVGPKDYDALARINPKLQQMIDWGWFGFLAKPLFLVTNWFNHSLVRSYGWAIVLVTIALNMILFPIKLSNMKSMRKMQALKPQIDAINAKYKNVGMRDPKKADQNQEVMDLYKTNHVNPMGGCFPMLLQIPFFIAFYKVFTIAVEMRGAGWLWVPDLSQPERFDIHFLPLIMIATQFLMQKMTPQPAGDPSQQKMMMFMPLIFGFFFWNLPSGLVLYYMTSNLVAMGQQWFFNNTAAAGEAARSVEPVKRSKVRK